VFLFHRIIVFEKERQAAQNNPDSGELFFKLL